MSWQLHVRSAETVLESDKVPSSQEIISLIKRVNPTSLPLPETDREYGYQIKNRLQNLLLENYGDTFHLAPHPYSPDIVLIKHNALPSIDACHADLDALSAKALDTVASVTPPAAEMPARGEAKAKLGKPAAGSSPREVLSNAQLLLEQYDYPQAEELLASLRIQDTKDLPTLLKAAELLVGEMGAYQRAIEVLLAQPRQVLKDKAVRELLAVTYHGNGMIPEARALFEATHPADLGKNALYAYADLSFKDGNLSEAYHLLKLSEQKEGFVTAHASLRKEIEAAMLEEAQPFFQQAEAALAGHDLAQAECLLQRALSLYPNFQKARHLAHEISARRTAADVARLWERFESSETVAARLDLLAQLLERDKRNSVRIRELMDRERASQKRETVEAHLHNLQALAAQQNWDDCFDKLSWLSREADEETYRRACQIAPCFSVLYQNRRLQRLSDQEAKELWLGFVRLKSLVEQGRAEDCWDQAQDLKQYFHSYREFKEVYDGIVERVQSKAREEVLKSLLRLEELEDQEEQEEGSQLAEARALVAQMRKRFPLLPAEEAAAYKEDAERVLYRLEPLTDGGGSILDYREAMRLGNFAKAAQLRESYDPPCPDLIRMIDHQIAEEFAICAEPMTLVVSPELVVDLATDSAPPGPAYFGCSDRHLLLREDDQTIIVLDVRRMSATKYRSPNFKDLELMEILPDNDLFLFVNTSTNNTVWRAVLSETESRFTATFQINEHFFFREAPHFLSLFMSSGRDNVYYAFIQDCEGLRFVKQNVGLTSSVERIYQATGEPMDAFRLSYQPDRFVIVTDSNTAILESNLAPTRGCSHAGTSQRLYYLGIDPRKSQIYALGHGLINVLNTKLRAVKQHLKAASAAHIELKIPAHICVEKSTALLEVTGNGMFYNMETNKFSQKFSRARLMSTETPSRWYYWEYEATEPAIILKDITEEVESLLEWQVLLSPGQDEAAAAEFVAKLENPALFTIVKSTGQPQGSEPVQG